MNSSVPVKAPAKLNLFLRVICRRHDGYHELHTLFQKITLFDELQVETGKGTGQVQLECTGIPVPHGPDNLACKAARAFLGKTGLDLDVKLRLHKNIPTGAGLGGGSSDAAAVITCLNDLASNPLSGDELMKLGLGLGADVPFFILDAPAAIGRGVGEILEPHAGTSSWFLLIWPGFAIKTAWAYSNLELTTPCHKTIFSAGHGHETAMWMNDLEKAVIPRYPEILEIKNALLDLGAETALMSGSGSTVFGVFNNRQAAIRASNAMTRQKGARRPFSEFVVRGFE